MLRLRRAELAEAAAAATARLARVEARLRSIESEGHMPADDVVIKTVPAVRVAELTGTAASYQPEDIGPRDRPAVRAALPAPGGRGRPAHRSRIARYEDEPGGGRRIVVHAGVTVSAPVGAVGDTGVRVVELPPFEAATIVHRGAMDDQCCRRPTPWPAGWRPTATAPRGYAREVNLECPPDREQWVTELQEPVAKA